MQRFEVQTAFLYGWENCWMEDDQPQTFATREAAQAELDDFLADIEDEIKAGHRAADEGYSPDDFQIVEVQP